MKFRLSHLALLLAVSTAITALSGVVATYWVARGEFRNVLDDDLENQSRLLAELLTSGHMQLESGELREVLVETFEAKDEETLWVSVYDLASGTVASNLPHSLPLIDDEDGDLELQLNQRKWLGFQQREDDIVVQLLRQEERFEDVQKEIYEDITAPMLWVSGVNLLLLALLIGLVLWPLQRLAKQLESRGAYSLAPLRLKSPAKEIVILRDALNGLMSGIEETLGRERQFANDIAHELRTPLTTLKLELGSESPDLAALKSEVDRLAQLVSQLLTLARVDQGHWHSCFETLRLDEIYSRELSRMKGPLDQAGMQLHSELSGLSVQGDSVLLEVLLRNLLNNVIRHCPAGTQVEVWLGMIDRQPVLRVTDTGPGLAPDQIESLNAGASRMDSRAGGLGLGLAICRRIADVHQARLTFSARQDGQPGLGVEVVFPETG